MLVKTIPIQTEMPAQLLEEAQMLISSGWYRNFDEILLDALRRFIESHQADLVEKFVREDVAWGLYGNE